MTLSIPPVLRDRRLVVVDVEGNGGQPPEIVEIAVLPVGQALRREDLSTWLIRPLNPITPFVTAKVHGIANADVADCPTWAEVADAVEDLLADRVLVAHNASVEHRVLGAHLPHWRPTLVLDTMRLAKHVWPDLAGGYELDRLIAHANLGAEQETGRRHRAGYDTRVTAELLITLVERSSLDWHDLVEVAALPGFTTQRVPGDPEPGLW